MDNVRYVFRDSETVMPNDWWRGCFFCTAPTTKARMAEDGESETYVYICLECSGSAGDLTEDQVSLLEECLDALPTFQSTRTPFRPFLYNRAQLSCPRDE